MSKGKDVINDLYTAGLLVVGMTGVSFLAKKVFKDSLGVPSTPTTLMKLAVALGISTVGVKYVQDKDYIPEELVKEEQKS